MGRRKTGDSDSNDRYSHYVSAERFNEDSPPKEARQQGRRSEPVYPASEGDEYVNRRVLREQTKGVRKGLVSEVKRQGGNDMGVAKVTNRTYDGMGGKPEGDSRDNWSNPDLKRVAATEGFVTVALRFLFGGDEPPKPTTSQEQECRNDTLADAAYEASKRANEGMNHPDDGGEGRWASWFIGSHADRDKPEPKAEQLKLDVEPKQEDYDVGDLLKDAFGFSFGLPEERKKK